MRNVAKDYLRHLALKGLSVKRIEGMGFKKATIKKYYRALKPSLEE